MTRKYALWQARQWLPLAGIILVVFLVCYLSSSALANVDISYPEYGYGTVDYPATNLDWLLVPAIIATLIVPFFVYSYRFSPNAADAFLQLPFKKAVLKRIRLLLGLAAILIPFAISFWLGVGIMAIRQTGLAYSFHYEWFAAAFAFSMVLLAAGYFASCFLVSLGNGRLDAALALLVGQTILMLSVSPLLYFAAKYTAVPGFSLAFETLCFYAPEALTGYFFADLIVKGTFAPAELYPTEVWLGAIIIYTVLFTVLGLAAALWQLLTADPSGENMGRKGYASPLGTAMPHAMMIQTAFLLAATLLYANMHSQDITSILVVSIAWALGYYILLALGNRSFAIRRKDLVGSGIVASGYVVLLLATAFTL